MMPFFTQQYAAMLAIIRSRGYDLLPMDALFRSRAEAPTVYLRHDVDRLPFRAVALARLERDLGARATYYFRSAPKGTFPAAAIRRIAADGMTVGYHYECLTRARGDVELAAHLFASDLQTLRQLAPVASAAMHGSPLSRHDNRDLWKHYPLSRFDLLGEAYLSLQEIDICYLTDTGGRFGSRHNRRDQLGQTIPTGRGTPHDTALALSPDRQPVVVLSTHPERWATTAPGYIQVALCDAGANLLKRIFSGHWRSPATNRT